MSAALALQEAGLEAVPALGHHVKLFVPGTEAVDAELADEKRFGYAESVAICFSGWYGGATIYEARGCWLSHQAGLVTEDVIPVEAYADEDAFEEHMNELVELALELKAKMGQEAVALECDGRLYLV
jgi:hypothetical protein